MFFSNMKILILLCQIIFCVSAKSTKLQHDHFFPFGPANSDLTMFKNDDDSIGPIDISTTFLFFNKTFESVFVNTNGILSFNRRIREFKPIPFPIDDLVGLAPLWCDVDTRNGGNVYYREILKEQELNLIGSEIRLAFSNFVNFRPTWGYVITWFEVAPYDGIMSNRNTFQTVIATNGRHSFTIFNYGKLMWSITGSSANHALAGFNSGENGVYFQLNGSLTSNILKISNGSNVEITGKYIYRIDESSIESGGCNEEGLLTVSPVAVFFFGNQQIEVSGPCFEFNDSVKLIYGDNAAQSVECEVYDFRKSLCPVPILQIVGRVPIKMVINNNFTFTGFVISKEINENNEIVGLEPMYAIEEIEDKTIRIEWPGSLLNDPDDPYRLFYLELDDENRTRTITLNETIFGNWTSINIADLKPITKSTLGKVFKGFLYIAKSAQNYTRIIIAKAVTFISKYRPSAQCEEWYSSQPDPEPYLNNLPPCWRFIVLTNGRFPQSIANFTIDPACNPNTWYGPYSCAFYHPGSAACYRSTASFTLAGQTAGQQCCYDSSGRLKVGKPGGGTLDLGHSQNFWDHFNKDVIPYFMCCKLTDNCDHYYKWRPSQDGTGWVQPTTGGGTGDPHFLTLDNLEYTFNGYGEFTFLSVREIGFEIQVRIGPLVENRKMSDGTVFKSVAAKGLNMNSIQVDLNSLNRVEIFVDGFLLDMIEFADMNVINFRGVDLILDRSRNGYALQFSNGIRVEVQLTEKKNALLLFTTVPRIYQRRTSGLLGNFDTNPNNDFILPNGTVLSIDKNDDKGIFNKFGKAWQVNANTTVFTYTDGYDFSMYTNSSYLPKFLSDGIVFTNATLAQLANERCGANQKCLFDVSSTGKLEIGDLNIKFEETIEATNEMFVEAAKHCITMSLNFNNGKYEQTVVNDYRIEYRFVCNDGFCLDGKSQISCQNGVNSDILPKCNECKRISGASSVFAFQSTILIIFICSLLSSFLNL